MAYLRNTNFNAADANSFTLSFWLRPLAGTWSSSLLDIDKVETYRGSYTTNCLGLSCVQSGNAISITINCQRAPEDSPSDPYDIYQDCSYYLWDAKSTYIDYYPYHPDQISLPDLLYDIYGMNRPGVATYANASGTVVTVGGTGWSRDIDFSSAAFDMGLSSWPYPDGTPITSSVDSVSAAIVGADHPWAYVTYKGTGINLLTTYKNRSYVASSISVLNGTWNHIMVAINNSTKTQSWKVNGVGRTGSITENSTYPNSPWSIKFNDTEVCLPTKASHPLFRMADFQLWAGQYIDTTNETNFAKFVQISEGKGYPVSPATATAAFGRQTMLFRGQASDASFWINRGSGGTFTKTGTITDFTPTPSYG